MMSLDVVQENSHESGRGGASAEESDEDLEEDQDIVGDLNSYNGDKPKQQQVISQNSANENDSEEKESRKAAIERQRSKFDIAEGDNVLSWVQRLEAKVLELQNAVRLSRDGPQLQRAQTQLECPKLKKFVGRKLAKSNAAFSVPKHMPLGNNAVIVVGAGAVGSYIVDGLARAGLGNIGIIDNEVIDDDCIKYTTYKRKHVGWPKSVAARSIIQNLSSEANVLSMTESVSDHALDSLCGDLERKRVDLVICCLKDTKTRWLVNSWCVSHSTPLIDTTIFADATRGLRGGIHDYTTINTAVEPTTLYNCGRCDQSTSISEDSDSLLGDLASFLDAGFSQFLAGITLTKAVKHLTTLPPTKYTSASSGPPEIGRLYTSYSQMMDQVTVSVKQGRQANLCECSHSTNSIHNPPRKECKIMVPQITATRSEP